MKKGFDPYEELGVDRDASEDDVRQAYRKKAAKAHPDAGGSRDKFALVALAKDVLTNDKRRAKYDASGDIDDADGNPDQIESGARQIISLIIDALIDADPKDPSGRGVDIFQQDLSFVIIKNLEVELTNTHQLLDVVKRNIARAEKMEKKFKRKNKKGPNLMALFAKKRAQDEKIKATPHEMKISALKRALEIAADFTFEADPAQPDPYAGYAGSFSGTTIRFG